MHTEIKNVKPIRSLPDVIKFLNENGFRLDDVQIVHTYNPRGSSYIIFYEADVEDK